MIEKDLKIQRITEIVKENKKSPLNEIKRLVKKEYPDINIDTLVNIITEKKILVSEKAKRKMNNRKLEKER